MKKNNYLLFAIIALSVSVNVFAQDVIVLKTGEDIQAKVIEIDHDEIKFKQFDMQDGPTRILKKSDIFMVKYENGTKDVFNDKKESINNLVTPDSNIDYFALGEKDARLYYKGYKGAGTGTFIGGLIGGPIIGLIPAIATSSSKPNYKNLNFPKESLMNNPEYFKAYTQKAKRIKQGKVWMNYGISVGINITASIVAAVIIDASENGY